VRRLSLISDGADRELDAIRATVRVFEPVASADDAIAKLEAHAQQRTRAEVVDLIGHSQGHGFVTLGTWLLDDSPHTSAIVRDRVRPALDAIGARTIRLLGCSTAVTERGVGAMRRIELACSRRVYGTRRHVGKHDYGPEGFISDHVLADQHGPLPARPDPVGLLASAAMPVLLTALELDAGPRLHGDQPIVPLNAAIADEVLGFVDGARSWVVPGLLAQPLMILLWSRDNTIHRLDILCDYHLVRGYGAPPDDVHGRLFRVDDAEAFSHYLDAVIHPRTGYPRRRS
jgi:hypothetical protein